jgi:hypothetical protein
MVVGIFIAAESTAGRFVGHRVYLRNSTICEILVTHEHDGFIVKPGETVLVKSGLIGRTPTMMISANWDIWFWGLHFSADRLHVRGNNDITFPSSWLKSSLFGTTLTFDLTRQGQLIVLPPNDAAQLALPQPEGLPLQHQLSSRSNECISG